MLSFVLPTAQTFVVAPPHVYLDKGVIAQGWGVGGGSSVEVRSPYQHEDSDHQYSLYQILQLYVIILSTIRHVQGGICPTLGQIIF